MKMGAMVYILTIAPILVAVGSLVQVVSELRL